MSYIPAQIIPEISDLLDRPPVDVQEIAKRFGSAIYQKPLAKGVSGMLLRDSSFKTPSGFVIFVNAAEAYVRQRFTAAHEIGHLKLHHDRIGKGIEDNYLLRAEGMSSAMEVEANKFAADLLMPWPLLNNIISTGSQSVPSLAEAFNVSEIAMAIRLGHVT